MHFSALPKRGVSHSLNMGVIFSIQAQKRIRNKTQIGNNHRSRKALPPKKNTTKMMILEPLFSFKPKCYLGHFWARDEHKRAFTRA